MALDRVSQLRPQMHGVFFLKDRRIARAFRHREISDEPDYLKLIRAA